MSHLGNRPDKSGIGSQVAEEYSNQCKQESHNIDKCGIQGTILPMKNLSQKERSDKYNDTRCKGGKTARLIQPKSVQSTSKYKLHTKQSLIYKQGKSKRRKIRRRQQRENNNDQSKDDEKHYQTAQGNCQYNDNNVTWGDEITMYDTWRQEGHKSFRILHYNVNGILAEDIYIEWETTM